MKRRFSGLKKEIVDGTTKYFAYGFSQWVEVSEEVYRFMASNGRRQRYIDSREAEHRAFSFDAYKDEHYNCAFVEQLHPRFVGASPEEAYIADEAGTISAERITQIVLEQINALPEGQHKIADLLLIKRKSLRECAKITGVSVEPMQRKAKRICQDLYTKCLIVLRGEHNGE